MSLKKKRRGEIPAKKKSRGPSYDANGKRRYLAVSDVAKILGVSVRRVHQLDDDLEPIRTPSGIRFYSSTNVERVRAERAKG